MSRFLSLLLCFVLSASTLLVAQDAPAWQQELAARHQTLIDRNGPGTDAALRDQLLKMRDQDRAARGVQPGTSGKPAIATNLAEIDAALTDQLKSIVARGWPTIALVGIDASNAAMLILTHTADHAWQQSMIPQLVGLADAGQIDGSALALVVDKQLIAEGRLQRYGTQFRLVDGAMAMYAVEDPDGLDRRRSQVLLPPMEIYRLQLETLYHLKVSKQIVMAPQPAK